MEPGSVHSNRLGSLLTHLAYLIGVVDDVNVLHQKIREPLAFHF